jgi:hypothetical protein
MSWQAAATLKQDALFIINWSWFERFDYVDVDTETDDWAVTHPRHEEKLDHYFYRNLDSDIWNLHRNLQQMHSTISLLKQNNIDFVITCIDPHYSANFDNMRPPGSTVSTEWNSAISNLQEQVVPYIVDFEGMSFLEWSKHKQYPIGPNGHPLEKAHIEAAKYINTVITKESQNEH